MKDWNSARDSLENHLGLSNFAWHLTVLPAVTSRGSSSRRSLSTLSRLSPETANLLRVTPCGTTGFCRTPVGATWLVPPSHWPFSSTRAALGRVGPPAAPPSSAVPPFSFLASDDAPVFCSLPASRPSVSFRLRQPRGWWVSCNGGSKLPLSDSPVKELRRQVIHKS